MKAYLPTILCCTLGLTACAAVYTDGSDANKVTFLNSSGESISELSQKAGAYCAQYGKVATFRNIDTKLVAIFDCRSPN